MKPGNMMKTLMAAQTAIGKVQSEVEASHFIGTSGGNLVRLEINGKCEGVKLDIDPAVLSEGPETVADLVMAALNAASAQREALSKSKLKEATSRLLPLGIKIPGLG